MSSSSRTPEGNPNSCPICGKDTRTETSFTPTRDASCPHCGQLLWFTEIEDELVTLPPRSSKSYEGAVLAAGRQRLGDVPVRLIYPLLQAVGALVAARRIRELKDIDFLAEASSNWTDLTYRMRRLAGLDTRFNRSYSVYAFVRRQF